MKDFAKKYIVLIVCLALGLGSCAAILAGRSRVERRSMVYDLVLDYATTAQLAAQSGDSVESWLELFRENGVDKLAMDISLPHDAAEALGYTVIPLAAAGDGDEAALEAMLEYNSPYFFNVGDRLISYDSKWALGLERYLDVSGAVPVLTETADVRQNLSWEGFDDLIEARDYRAVRCFYMYEHIMGRYASFGYEGSQELTNILYRAVYERDCRIVYLKPMYLDAEKGVYVTDRGEYSSMLENLRARLAQRGWEQGVAEPMDYYSPSPLLLGLAGLGAAAAALLLLFLIFPMRPIWSLLLLPIMLAEALVYGQDTDLFRLALSIGGGIVMPAIFAVLLSRSIVRNPGNRISAAAPIAAPVGMAAISLCGSLFTAAALSETGFMLEQKIYRGVKLMQLAPIGIFLLSLVYFFLRANPGFAPLKWLRSTVKRLRARHWLAIGAATAVLAAIGAYYLHRTGNSTFTLPFEPMLRGFMERTLAARPRIKEFIIGYPCLMLLVWCLRRKLPLPAALLGHGAVIGSVSVVNTFLHIRTFVYLSFIRVFYGLAFGLALGLIALGAAELLYRLITKKVEGR